MLTGLALSMYMCRNNPACIPNPQPDDSANADFCFPLKTILFEMETVREKNSSEIDARSYNPDPVRPIIGSMEAPKKFTRTNKHKKENRKKWTCRCNCSNHANNECNAADEEVIQELNILCCDAVRREQKKEDERDLAALETYRNEPLVPSDAEDCVVAPWPSCGRVDEDVDGVVGRDEGWCLIEHDVKVDITKDLLEGVESQAG